MPETSVPEFRKHSFHCPYCKIHARQEWDFVVSEFHEEIHGYGKNRLRFEDREVWFSTCHNCENPAFWFGDKIVFPNTGIYPPANTDMPDDVKEIYDESGAIAVLSPRAACALLRLSLEMLLKQLGERDSINDAIANLVSNRLPLEIQEAMDTLRVTGNQAVHVGKISFDGDTDVEGLFSLLNAIVYDRITLPRERKKMYNNLPISAKNQIAKRDSSTKQ